MRKENQAWATPPNDEGNARSTSRCGRHAERGMSSSSLLPVRKCSFQNLHGRWRSFGMNTYGGTSRASVLSSGRVFLTFTSTALCLGPGSAH